MTSSLRVLIGVVSVVIFLAHCGSGDDNVAGNDGDSGLLGKGGKGGTGGKNSAGQGGSSGATSTGGSGVGVSGSSGGGSAGASGSGNPGGTAAGGSSAGGASAGGNAGVGGVCQIGGSPGSGASAGFPVGASEICGNGIDDDGNGFIDEVCSCALGATQECFPGNPIFAGKGACKKGLQTCQGGGEFTGWGPCQGAVLPVTEVCEGQNDENCDGVVDDGCGCCPGATAACGTSVGVCKPGVAICQPNGVLGACEGAVEPSPKEICGNGLDDDCNGLVDEGCTINVEININGDCVCSAPCPPQAPYPVGCQVDFIGGDDRGCVAVAKSQVYFQEGDACGAGKLTGKLLCSSEQGPGLNATNCPINKPKPTYGKKPSDCVKPSGTPDSCYF